MGEPIRQLNLSPDERWVLEKWASYPEFPRPLSRQARAILAFAEGENERTISRELRTSKETVADWCDSFASFRLDSMCHERRGRKPPAVTLSKREFLMLKSLTERPKYQGPLTRRARMILACAEGKRDTVVAQETGLCVHEVTKWRSRFLALRLKGLDGGVSHVKTSGTRVGYEAQTPELKWTEVATAQPNDHRSTSL
jgi:transposase